MYCLPVASDNCSASVPNLMSELRGQHASIECCIREACPKVNCRTFGDVNMTFSEDIAPIIQGSPSKRCLVILDWMVHFIRN